MANLDQQIALDPEIAKIYEKHLNGVNNFAIKKNINVVDNIENIDSGEKYYEVNLNNNLLSNQHTKNETSKAESTKPLFLVTNMTLGPHAILEVGGKRKSRRNQKSKKIRKGKTRKNRRKSNRRRL